MHNSDLTTLADARLARRLTAGIYDVFLLFAVAFLYTMVVALIANAMGLEPQGLVVEESGETMKLTADDEYRPMLHGVLYQLGLYLSLALFYLGFWRTRHATLGMQTWRLRLIDTQGNPPSWKQLLIRALTGTLSLFCFGLGFLYSLIDKQNRTLHDIASNTRVVVIPKPTKSK